MKKPKAEGLVDRVNYFSVFKKFGADFVKIRVNPAVPKMRVVDNHYCLSYQEIISWFRSGFGRFHFKAESVKDCELYLQTVHRPSRYFGHKTQLSLFSGYIFLRDINSGRCHVRDNYVGLTGLDQQMMAWADDLQLPVHILLTKADKLSRGKAQSVMLDVQRKWLGAYDASVQLFSAPKRIGVDQAREKLTSWLLPEEIEDTPS